MSNEPIIKNPLVIVPETVEEFKTQNKYVNPSTSMQVIRADQPYDALASVVINPATSNEPIYDGATTGADGEIIGYKLEARRTVSPQQEEALTVKANKEEGFDGIEEVIVRPIPSNYIIPAEQLEIATNGEYDVRTYASVSVDVKGGSGGNNNIDIARIISKSTLIANGLSISATNITTTGAWNDLRLENGAQSSGVGSISPYSDGTYLYWTQSGRIIITNNGAEIGSYNGIILVKEGAIYNIYALGYPNETLYIWQNGDYNVSGFSSISVGVALPTAVPLFIDENGTYNAPNGTMYNPVTVNIDTAKAFYGMKEKLVMENIGSLVVGVKAQNGGFLSAVNIDNGNTTTTLDISYDRGSANRLFIFPENGLLSFGVNGQYDKVATFIIAEVNSLTSGVEVYYCPAYEAEGAWEIGSSLSNYAIIPANIFGNDIGLKNFLNALDSSTVSVTVSFRNGQKLIARQTPNSSATIAIYNSVGSVDYYIYDGYDTNYNVVLRNYGGFPYDILDITASGIADNTYTATEIAVAVGAWLDGHLGIYKEAE